MRTVLAVDAFRRVGAGRANAGAAVRADFRVMIA